MTRCLHKEQDKGPGSQLCVNSSEGDRWCSHILFPKNTVTSSFQGDVACIWQAPCREHSCGGRAGVSEHLCGVGAQGRAAPQAHSGQEEGRDPTGSTIQVAVLWEGFCFHLYSQAMSKYGKVERK